MKFQKTCEAIYLYSNAISLAVIEFDNGIRESSNGNLFILIYN